MDDRLIDSFLEVPSGELNLLSGLAAFGIMLTGIACLLLHLGVIYFGARGFWDLGRGKLKQGIIELTLPMALYFLLLGSLALGYANLGVWLGLGITAVFYGVLRWKHKREDNKSTVVANSGKQV